MGERRHARARVQSLAAHRQRLGIREALATLRQRVLPLVFAALAGLVGVFVTFAVVVPVLVLGLDFGLGGGL